MKIRRDVAKVILVFFCIIFFIVGYINTKRFSQVNNENIIIDKADNKKEDQVETREDLDEQKNKSSLSEKDDDTKDKIFVHITGAINKPGVYELSKENRLKDLIYLCGGLTKKADIERINLAIDRKSVV